MTDSGETDRWAAGAAFVDGQFCPISEAKISVLDLGVTRGDCTYDVAGVWNGRFFRLDAHLDRFMNSLAHLRLDIGRSRDQLEDVLHECVTRAGLQNSFVSMTCTRGRPAAGSRDLRTCTNNFYCFAIPYIWIVSEDLQAVGTSMWISDIPRIPPESVDPSVKNYHWLDMDMAQLSAYDNGAQLVVLGGSNGVITEGPGYNVFAFVDGRWLTPVAGTLQGVTRRTVIELCDQAGHPAEQGVLTSQQLLDADEIFACSTAGGIMPVTTINGRAVADGRVGTHTAALRATYWQRHDDPLWTTPVRTA